MKYLFILLLIATPCFAQTTYQNENGTVVAVTKSPVNIEELKAKITNLQQQWDSWISFLTRVNDELQQTKKQIDDIEAATIVQTNTTE